MASESVFERKFIEELESIFPGCVIIKIFPFCQGMPDRIILFENRWAMFEVKKERTSKHQPNQDEYVKHFNSMSYASFVYPENKDQVIHELQQALRSGRQTRFFKP